jgi:mono/diheme cytochrome c family protein
MPEPSILRTSLCHQLLNRSACGLTALCGVILLSGLLVGCDGIPGRGEAVPEHQQRVTDPEVLRRGESLYQQYCAVCHGAERQGAENWYRRLPDGTWLPPPLDGSGHTWHHPYWQLKDMIRYGAEARGGRMPGFEDILTDEDVEAIIAWLQSKWPDEIFEAWREYDDIFPTQEAWEESMGAPWVTHPDHPDAVEPPG